MHSVAATSLNVPKVKWMGDWLMKHWWLNRNNQVMIYYFDSFISVNVKLIFLYQEF